jgi:hypothetical protein
VIRFVEGRGERTTVIALVGDRDDLVVWNVAVLH